MLTSAFSKIRGLAFCLAFALSLSGYSQTQEQESNNDLGTAMFIGEPGQVTGTLKNLEDREDWFSFVTDKPGKIRISFSGTIGEPLGMGLYNKLGGSITYMTSLDTDGEETLQAECMKPDTFFVYMSHWIYSDNSAEYTLTIELLPDEVPMDSPSNDFASSPQSLGILTDSLTVRGNIRYFNGNISEVNRDVNDWFLFITEKPGRLTMVTDSGLIPQLFLYFEDGVSTVPGSGNQYCIGADTFMVRLSSSLYGPCGGYKFRLLYETADTLTENEQNDDINSAHSLNVTEGQFSNTTLAHLGGYTMAENAVVQDKADWFFFHLNEPSVITSFIITPGYGSNLNYLVEAYTRNSNKLPLSSVSDSLSKIWHLKCAQEDTIFIKVLHTGGCGYYSIDAYTQNPPVSGEVDTEPNNSGFAGADLLTSNQKRTGALGFIDYSFYPATTRDNNDFYIIQTNARSDAFITLGGLNPAGISTANLSIYNKDQQKIFSEILSEEDFERELTCLEANDTVYLEVLNATGCGFYSIEATLAQKPYANDNEPNDEYTQAEIINLGSQTNLVKQGQLGYIEDEEYGFEDDTDFYLLKGPFSGSIELLADVDGESSDVIEFDFSLYKGGSLFTTIGGVTVPSDESKYLDLECTSFDSLYLRVSLKEGSCPSYEMDLTFTPTLSNDDGYDQVKGSSLPLRSNETKEGRIGFLVPGHEELINNQDFYSLQTDNEEEVYILTLIPENEQQVLGLAIYDGISVLDYQSTAGADNNKAEITLSCFALDKYLVQVINEEGCGGYTLSCQPTGYFTFEHDTEYYDFKEVNAALGSPYQGQIGRRYKSSFIDFFDSYFYEIKTPSTLKFTVTAGEENLSDLEIYVEQNDVFLIDLIIGPGLSAEGTIECMLPDSVFVTIQGSCGSYEINLEELSAAPGTDEEPNNVLMEAVDLSGNQTRIGTLGYLDYRQGGNMVDEKDIYAISSNQSGKGFLVFSLDPPDAQIEASILSESGTTLTSWNVNDGTSVSFDYPSPGLKNYLSLNGSAYEDCLNYSFSLSFGTNTHSTPSERIRIYPIPAENYLRIEGQENLRVEITDLSGKIIYRKEINDSSVILDTREWKKGMYILKVVSGKSGRTERIVIE